MARYVQILADDALDLVVHGNVSRWSAHRVACWIMQKETLAMSDIPLRLDTDPLEGPVVAVVIGLARVDENVFWGLNV